MKRVYSISLFLGPQASRARDDSFYYDFVRPYVRAFHNCFGEWELRIHHDGSSALADGSRLNGFLDACPYGPAVRELDKAGLVKLVDCGAADLRNRAMLWRLKPLFEEDVEAVVCRDIDSIPTPRERRAVEEWLSGGMIVHGINDSISHTMPLLGGLCGFLGTPFRERFACWANWDAMIEAAKKFMGSAWERPGMDQTFLNGYLWPRLGDESFLHRLKGRHPAHGGRVVREQIWDRPPWNVTSEVLAGGDQLLAHLGASGFDWIVATEFYRRCGKPGIEAAIAAAEAAGGK